MQNEISLKALYKTFGTSKFLFVSIVFLVAFAMDLLDLAEVVKSTAFVNIVNKALELVDTQIVDSLSLTAEKLVPFIVPLKIMFMIPNLLLGISALNIYVGAKGEKANTFVGGAKTLRVYSLINFVVYILGALALLAFGIFFIVIFANIPMDNLVIAIVLGLCFLFLVAGVCGSLVMAFFAVYFYAFAKMTKGMVAVAKGEAEDFRIKKFFIVVLWILGISTFISFGGDWGAIISVAKGLAYIFFALVLGEYDKNYKDVARDVEEKERLSLGASTDL